MNNKELLNKVESQRKDIEYWKKKCKDLEDKLQRLEDYKRGFVDATYYCGGHK